MNPPVIIDPNRGLDIASQLAKKENEDALRMIADYKKKMSRVTLAIEKVLIEEDMSWQDFKEVIKNFNDRNDAVFPKFKIAEIKERYDRSAD